MSLSPSRGPAASEVEVNLFGPGYGESVLIHLGDDRWLIVDSCSEKLGSEPAALAYLRSIGRDPAVVVRYLVATHWHDDHVRGFSHQVDVCASARVWFTPALQYDTLLTIAEASSYHPVGGVRELAATLRTLVGNGTRQCPDRTPAFALENTALHVHSVHPGTDVELWALSPSYANVVEGYHDIRRLIPEDEWYLRPVPRPEHNHSSIVLFVRVGDQSLLLGGDREQATGSNRGWESVNQCWGERGLSRATVVKVAHHGSPNGDSELIWTSMLETDPHALVAPYYRGHQGGRPRPEDVDRLLQNTSNVYITSVGKPGRLTPVDDGVEDMMDIFDDESGIEVEFAQPPMGQIRMRAERGGGSWHVDLVPPAAHLSPTFTS